MEISTKGRESGDARLLHLLEGLEIIVTLEEPTTGEQLPEDDSEREDVTPAVHLFPVGRLGGEVAILALHEARVGALELARGLGETEVGNLHLALAADEDVGRAHIAMNDAEQSAFAVFALVRVGERLADLDADLDRDGGWEGAPARAGELHQGLEVCAIHILHDDEVGFAGAADIEDRDDVGVAEREREAGLVKEHVDELGVRGELREHPLDGHLFGVAVEAHSVAAKDLRHAANIDAVDDLVAGPAHAARRRRRAGALTASAWFAVLCSRRRPAARRRRWSRSRGSLSRDRPVPCWPCP